MNPQSAAIAGSGNPLKSRFESKIRAKIFSKSADPFAYLPRSLRQHDQCRVSTRSTYQLSLVLVVEYCTLKAIQTGYQDV